MAWANDCRRLGRGCRRDSQCCSKNCVRLGDDKVCGCPEGKTRCGVRCVNLQTNERHCGECFNRCEEGQECVDGECGGGCVSDGGACSGDTDCCNGFCNSNICASCRAPGGACPEAGRCCSNVCAEGVVCLPPGGGNYVECACVDNTGGSIFCSSAACGSSELDQVCVALCAMHGGVANLQCTACSTNCGGCP
jgi:stigma-specific protein Stig1